ncbi:MAG TPA: PA2169 family four-helix-bundle protein, partial [Phycisphaerales bacterium]|nr:PA2169 family four-helix-bundle protein [Phycisphaerales bacterium]
SGTAAGSLHRWWLGVRASVGAVNTRAVLEEAERGEDAIKHGYEEALREGSLGGITRVIGDQSVQVKRVHDEIRMLRDQWRSR